MKHKIEQIAYRIYDTLKKYALDSNADSNYLLAEKIYHKHYARDHKTSYKFKQDIEDMSLYVDIMVVN